MSRGGTLSLKICQMRWDGKDHVSRHCTKEASELRPVKLFDGFYLTLLFCIEHAVMIDRGRFLSKPLPLEDLETRSLTTLAPRSSLEVAQDLAEHERKKVNGGLRPIPAAWGRR